jgi:hypothetical protein
LQAPFNSLLAFDHFSLLTGISQKTASPGGLAVFLMIRGIVLLPRQRERAVEGEDAVADGV